MFQRIVLARIGTLGGIKGSAGHRKVWSCPTFAIIFQSTFSHASRSASVDTTFNCRVGTEEIGQRSLVVDEVRVTTSKRIAIDLGEVRCSRCRNYWNGGTDVDIKCCSPTTVLQGCIGTRHLAVWRIKDGASWRQSTTGPAFTLVAQSSDSKTSCLTSCQTPWDGRVGC